MSCNICGTAFHSEELSHISHCSWLLPSNSCRWKLFIIIWDWTSVHFTYNHKVKQCKGVPWRLPQKNGALDIKLGHQMCVKAALWKILALWSLPSESEGGTHQGRKKTKQKQSKVWGRAQSTADTQPVWGFLQRKLFHGKRFIVFVGGGEWEPSTTSLNWSSRLKRGHQTWGSPIGFYLQKSPVLKDFPSPLP